MSSYTFWFILFAFAAYFIATDESVAKAVFYISKIVRNKFEIMKWWAMNNPKLLWVRYSMHRRSMKMAEELMKELNKDQ
jgi:hypothetical protein